MFPCSSPLRTFLIVIDANDRLMFKLIIFKFPFHDTKVKKQEEITLKTLQIKIDMLLFSVQLVNREAREVCRQAPCHRTVR